MIFTIQLTRDIILGVLFDFALQPVCSLGQVLWPDDTTTHIIYVVVSLDRGLWPDKTRDLFVLWGQKQQGLAYWWWHTNLRLNTEARWKLCVSNVLIGLSIYVNIQRIRQFSECLPRPIKRVANIQNNSKVVYVWVVLSCLLVVFHHNYVIRNVVAEPTPSAPSKLYYIL